MGPGGRGDNATLPPSVILGRKDFLVRKLEYGLRGHIVVITRNLDDLMGLIRPLRAAHVHWRQIVIMCPIATMGTRKVPPNYT